MENKTSTKGKFITIEGCEGSGKTRQINMLRDRLESLGVDYVATREPGGTGISEKIRNILLDGKNREMDDVCEALLYAAARVHLRQVYRFLFRLPGLCQGAGLRFYKGDKPLCHRALYAGRHRLFKPFARRRV